MRGDAMPERVEGLLIFLAVGLVLIVGLLLGSLPTTLAACGRFAFLRVDSLA